MRRTGKRLGALLLALVMVLSLVPVTALAARTDDDAIAIEAPDAVQAADAGLPEEVADGPAALMAGEGPTNAADSRYDIALTAGMLSTKSTRYDDWATRLLDDDGTTYWEARWEGTSSADNVCFPTFAEAALEVNFTQATEVLGFRYQTKSGSNGDTNGAFVQWKIETKATQNGEWTVAKSSDDSTKWTGHTGGGWQMAKLDAATEVWGIRLVPQSFKHGAAADAEEQTTDNTNHLAGSSGGTDSENMSCAGLRVFGATKAAVEYNATNIDAGMFDVGYDDATGVYDNPLESSGAVNANTVVRAWASSQMGDNPAWHVVDGDTTNLWHSRWSGTSDNPITNPGNVSTNDGYHESKMQESSENRWIELDIMNGTSIGAPVLLNGLRYFGQDGNGRVTACEVRVSATESGDDWTTVTSSTDWTRGTGTASWAYKQFDYPVLACRVRLYGVTTTNSNKNMTAREIRLVKAESQSTDTRSFAITVKDVAGSAITGATVTCGGKTATDASNNGTYTITDLYDGDYTVNVAKDGLKAKTLSIKVSESSTSAEVTLYPPLSSDDLAAVEAHQWDYPIWAEVTDGGASASPRYVLTRVHGGSADAFSYSNHGQNKTDLPPWAALDNNTATLWHTFYGQTSEHNGEAGNPTTGYKTKDFTNGAWYEFTLDQKTSIIGVWVKHRAPSSGATTSACPLNTVTVRVSAKEDTNLSNENWLTLPVEGTKTLTANDTWQFVELSAPVEAKRVRIYSSSTGDIAAAELRVVMDPATSGAKQLTGTVKSSASGNAAIPGATVTVANRTATSGDDGTFDLGYLPAGTYSVTVSAPGYASKTENVTIGTDPVTLDWKLTPQTRTLTVTVNGTNEALEGATVTLLDNTANSNLPVSGVASDTTNESGVATLDVTYVAAGTYKLRVSHPDYKVNTTNNSNNSGFAYSDTVTLGDGDATANVTLTARDATKGATQGALTSVADLVKTYDFSTNQTADFQALVSENGATVAWDETKQAMKITFVDDTNSHKNLILNKKFAIKHGVVEFDATFEGTVDANDNFGSVMRYGDGKWVHVGQLNAANQYGATVHSAADQTTDFTAGTVNNVALADGVTRRFCFIMGELFSGDNGWSFETNRTHLMLDSGETGWKYTHSTNNLPIANDAGLWGFDAKNASGLVVYIDNIRVYRRNADKSEVTINALAEGSGTLHTNIVTELDTQGTTLATGGNAYTGDTVKISAEDVPTNKVFAVKVTKTGDANTVVTTTKNEEDGSFTFTMPAYPVTITPAAATQLTAADVVVSGTTAGSGNQIDGNPFPEKYVRVGQTLTVTPATGVSYQWQYSTDGSTWTNIANSATAASFQLTTAQYGSTNTKNQVRVVVTGDNTTYAGTITSEAVDVLPRLQEVTAVTFQRQTSGVTMWSNEKNDPNPENNAEEGKTTQVKAYIAPTDVSRPMTVTWTSSNKNIITISDQDNQAKVEGSGDDARLVVTATLTAVENAVTAENTPVVITCTATAKDGSSPISGTLNVTVKAKTKSVTVRKANAEGTAASDVEVNATDKPLVLWTNKQANSDDPIDPNHPNSAKLFAVPTPTNASDTASYDWHRQDAATGLIELRNTDTLANTRTIAVTGISEQNVGEKTIDVKIGDKVYGTFRVVVLRHLVHDVTVSLKGENVTEARPGVTVEAITSDLHIGDDGVAGLTYEWYRKAAATEDVPNPTAVKIPNQSGKTYKLTEADIGCEITVKAIAAPKYGTEVEAANRYYYEGELTSTNSITVLKNAGPEAPTLSKSDYSENSEGTPTYGTITIDGYQAAESKPVYEIKGGSWNDWTEVKTTEDGTAPVITEAGVIGNLTAATYTVRVKATAANDAGAEASITVLDSSKAYHAVTVTVKTQDFQGNDSATLKGGTATGDTNVEAGQSATLTVKPAEGFEILSVTGDGNTLTGTAGENGATDYTVSNVTAPVAFAVTFKQKSVTIAHTLTNLVCSLGNQSENTHEVAYGSVSEITLSLANGVNANAYELPERGTITIVKKSDSTQAVPFTYDQTSGKISLNTALTEDITITGSAKPRQYSVSRSQVQHTTLDFTDGAKATYNTDFVINLTPETNYTLPDAVTVKRGAASDSATELTAGTDYTYDKEAKKITIKGTSITNNLFITVQSDLIKTSLTKVEIQITHAHTAPDDSGATETDVPHVGDTLTATVTPDAGSNASYKWYTGGQVIEGETNSTYQVKSTDKNQVIKVEVTGTGTFSGRVEAQTKAVKDPVIAVKGVNLNKTTTSIVFGGTDTLTVTFDPTNATNKNVTWGTSNANVATVADGVVTATGVGTATITVRTANGREATCTVTVTPKPLTNDDTATVRVGGALELGQTVTANLVPENAATGATYAWSIVDASTGATVYEFVDNGKSVTLPTDSDYLGAKVKVVVTYNGNYTGTKTRITQGVIAGEVPSHSVVIATGIANGTVTADKTTAKQGETVTLTIAPAAGYELDVLTVTGYHNETVGPVTKVDDTHYTFDMPRNLGTGDVVNVTATFKLAPVTPTTHTVTFTLNDATLTVVSGGTAAGSVVTVSDAATLTFKLTPPTGKVVKAVKDGTSLITPVEGVYTISNITVDKTVTVELEAGSVTPPDPVKPDTTQLAAAIADANAAMENITISDKDVDAVKKGVEYYPQSAVDALTEAVKDAEAVLNNANATQDEVDAAVTTLNNAVTAFGETKKIGAMDDADLVAAIEAARTAKATVYTINDEPANVKQGIQFVTTDEMNALNDAIDAAQAALDNPDKDQTTLNEAKDALTEAMETFEDAKKTGTNPNAEAPVVDTTALQEAIDAANAAKAAVTVKPDGTTENQVNRGTKFVTQEVMDALIAAIDAANTELETPGTDGSVSNAVDALYAALEDFNAATKIGTKSTGSSTPSTPVFTTETETKPDGTKVTTVTDNRTGTVTETTEKPDGSKEVVETKKDGTITETKTDPEGAKTEKVTTPEKDVTITVTDKDGEELAKVALPAELPETETRFEDVPEDHWANQAIHSIAALELVEGVGGKKYAPADSMTRGALATVLHRLSQGKTDYELTFQDVTATKFYAPSIAWAAKAGVVKGFNADIFAPDQIITREQLAVMLARYAKLIGMDTSADANAIKTFSDAAQTGDWAVDGMAWCVSAGILQGKDGNRLDPTANVSRAEAALMLDRFIAAIMK